MCDYTSAIRMSGTHQKDPVIMLVMMEHALPLEVGVHCAKEKLWKLLLTLVLMKIQAYLRELRTQGIM